MGAERALGGLEGWGTCGQVRALTGSDFPLPIGKEFGPPPHPRSRSETTGTERVQERVQPRTQLPSSRRVFL